MDAEPALANPADKLILLVDDDPSFLDLMEIVVSKAGFRTERAVGGKEALGKVGTVHPDLIVLDMMMPGLGGYEVTRELQAGGFEGIPVVMVTGRRMDRASVDALRREANVREFLEKPVRAAVLVMAIHKVLNTKPAAGA